MTLKYIDIHSHLHFPAYKDDREKVIKRALDEGVWVVNIGTNKKTSEEVISLSEKYEEGVYASVGLHPINTDASFCCDDADAEGGIVEDNFDYQFYKKLAKNPKVVAIGECGLDFFHLSEENRFKQIEVFEKQIELALEVNKPLMLHVRNAYEEVLKILNTKYKIQDSNLRGNVHFFAGDLETAKKFLNIGFSLSFTGVITYPKGKNNPDYDEVIRYTPIDMIMAETDAPYVAPVPHRGQRNESFFVIEVIKRIAEIKKMPFEETARILFNNSKKFLSL